MKRMIKRIVALMCIATLFIIPSASVSASLYSQPVLTYSTTTEDFSFKTFTYQPEFLDVLSLQTVSLIDTTGQPLFNVPIGQSFTFGVAITRGNFHCKVWRLGNNNAELVYSVAGEFGSFYNAFEPVDYPSAYIIELTSVASSTAPTSRIHSYQVAWYY